MPFSLRLLTMLLALCGSIILYTMQENLSFQRFGPSSDSLAGGTVWEAQVMTYVVKYNSGTKTALNERFRQRPNPLR